MTLAVLYDVHGNLPALDAVLADARERGAGSFLLGGDYALFGAFAGETVARLKELDGAVWLRGNVDRWTAEIDLPDDRTLREAVAACREALGDRIAEELGGLPEQVVLDGTRYCHASPASDMLSFLPEPADEEDELLAGAGERRVVFGHTHLQFRRMRADGIELLNPGSVGMPLDGDVRAAYAVLDAEGELALHRVEYDPAPCLRALESFSGAEWAERTVRRLRTARP